MEIYTHSEDETRALGYRMGREAKPGVYCLYGELGGGKTTFVQGFAKGTGYHGRTQSPTFVLMRHYGHIYHLDLYRLTAEEEVRDLGFEEICADPENIVLIEWAEKARLLLPKKRTDITFDYIDDTTRLIHVLKL